MGDWKLWIGGLFAVLYLLMGFVHLAATLGGIKAWWGWPWWIAIFVAMPVAYIPVLGTVLAVMGAIESFGWSPRFAILFFCWPFILYMLLGAGLAAVALCSTRKG